jgi:hypothetical protein
MKRVPTTDGIRLFSLGGHPNRAGCGQFEAAKTGPAVAGDYPLLGRSARALVSRVPNSVIIPRQRKLYQGFASKLASAALRP